MARIRDTVLFHDTALKGYWLLDGDFKDAFSSSYDLTPNNSPTFVSGQYGQSAQFVAASNQNAYQAIATAPNIDTTGSQTWVCWIKFTTFISYESLMSLANSDGSVNRSLIGSNDSAEHSLYWQIPGLSTAQINTTGFTFNTGVWYHIAGVYDSAVPELRIYINGVSNNSSSTSGTPTAIGGGNPNNAFALASRGDSATVYPLNGVLDDAAIFTRALTAAEILNLASDPGTTTSTSSSTSTTTTSTSTTTTSTSTTTTSTSSSTTRSTSTSTTSTITTTSTTTSTSTTRSTSTSTTTTSTSTTTTSTSSTTSVSTSTSTTTTWPDKFSVDDGGSQPTLHMAIDFR